MKYAAITIIALLFCPFLYGAERVLGTKVFLDVPEGFESAGQFPGYTMDSENASIMVTEIAAPYAGLSEGLTAEKFAEREMELLEKTEAPTPSGAGLLLHVSQAEDGVNYRKWMRVIGGELDCVMVQATYPAEHDAKLSATLKAAVLSATWDPGLKIDFFEGLNFRIDELHDLKIANKIGNTLVITRDGVVEQPDRGAPLVVIGASLSESWTPPEDTVEYARSRFLHAGLIVEPKLISEGAIKVDGLDGYLIEAGGKEKESGQPIYVLQGIIFAPEGYYLLQGTVGAADHETYAKVFLDILHSFTRV